MIPNHSISNVQPLRPEKRCDACGYIIFDGQGIKSRYVRLLPVGAQALCRCKNWVGVPMSYSG